MAEDTYPPGSRPLENIAQTLARELPMAREVLVVHAAHEKQGCIRHVAVPKGWELKAIDNEPLLARPRRIHSTATMGDEVSFVDHVNRHKSSNSVLWVNFNPQTYALDFTAVFDEHAGAPVAEMDTLDVWRPGWRQHRATFKPAMSLEWQRWTAKDTKSFEQVAFAEFIEQNESDIHAADGYPTSLHMLKVATEFQARAELSVKSVARLQSGGVRLEYINDPQAGTTDFMEVPVKFMIAIPVFWGVKNADETIPAYRIEARLKYRLQQQKVFFTYELIRPDRRHEQAAVELIGRIRDGVGDMPVLLGSAT